MNKVTELFKTPVKEGSLGKSKALNKKLLQDIASFSKQDKMGQTWSAENYGSGYTSYASLSDMHRRCPSFAELADHLQMEAQGFAKKLDWNLRGLELEMTHCWINIMPKHCYHTLHLHPHSVLSGTYYVQTPPGSVALKLEDPRMGFFMNAPVREKEGLYYSVRPKEGHFILFESWLRHEVPPNQSSQPRISVSFNYSLTEK